MNLNLNENPVERLKNSLARDSFRYFVTQSNADYTWSRFHETIADELDAFLKAVERREGPRLAIMAPPRSGKSELGSRLFPAYAMGRNPDMEFIGTSYSADLATAMSRDVQSIMMAEAYQGIFPDTQLPGKHSVTVADRPKRTAELFEIVGRKGKYRAAGVGGGITGMGADIALIDDPVKDAADAASPTYRQKAWDWYTSTLLTRVSPGGGVLVIMTRWHEDDLLGRIIDKEPDWTVLRFPAIAENDSDDWRKEGEALAPNRYDVPELLKTKERVGPMVWAGLYQQRPAPADGGLIKDIWLKRYTVPPQIQWRIITGDTASKTGQSNDYSVFQLWGYGSDNRAYLLDQLRGKYEMPELQSALLGWIAKHRQGAPIRAVHIEDAASGVALNQVLRRQGGLPLSPIKRGRGEGDKVFRVNNITGHLAAGNVLIPEQAPWVHDFVSEMVQFPSGAHDDQVDAFADGVNLIFNKPMRAPRVIKRPV